MEVGKKIDSILGKVEPICFRVGDITRRASLIAELVKNLPAGDPGSIPGLGRSVEEGIGNPLQYSWASLVA